MTGNAKSVSGLPSQTCMETLLKAAGGNTLLGIAPEYLGQKTAKLGASEH